MIPRRFRNWILVWTPLVWLVLELCTYPKTVSLSDGAAAVLRGFFAASVARYPAFVILIPGVCLTLVGITALVRSSNGRAFPLALTALGLEMSVWGLAAAGLPAAFSLTGQATAFGWLWQTVAVTLLAACVWTWGATNPERTDLAVWNLRETWRLYKGNWQGMVGLAIVVLFGAIALLAPFLAAWQYLLPNAQVGEPLSPPSLSSYYALFGTDEQGLSVLAEFVWSSRISLTVGLMATLISTVLGAGVGIGAGFYSGWRSEVSMRATDAFLVIPWLPLAMVLATAWGQSYGMIIVIIGITSWPGTARVVRAQTLSIRELPFVERGRAVGSGNWHIMAKHILPNVMPLIFANTVLVVAVAILSETTLSFLGLGDALNFSWGTMLRNAWQSGGAQLPGLVVFRPSGHRHHPRRARLHVHRHGLRRGARSQAAQARGHHDPGGRRGPGPRNAGAHSRHRHRGG